jgi:uncharacterized membrane protein
MVQPRGPDDDVLTYVEDCQPLFPGFGPILLHDGTKEWWRNRADLVQMPKCLIDAALVGTQLLVGGQISSNDHRANVPTLRPGLDNHPTIGVA